MAPYDEIISLGNHCRVAYNLRRTFGITRAFPFDWWITPASSLVAFLDDPSLDKLYDPQRLAPVMNGEKIFAIDNLHYGIQLQHEFPRGKGGGLVADWPEHLGAARQRTAYLWDRMVGLMRSDRRILFVRWFADAERRAMKGNGRPTVEAIRAGLQQLATDAAFELLLADPPEWIDAPGVSTLQVNDRGPGWKGSPDLWRERLLGHGIRWTGAPAAMEAAPDPDADREAYA